MLDAYSDVGSLIATRTKSTTERNGRVRILCQLVLIEDVLRGARANGRSRVEVPVEHGLERGAHICGRNRVEAI